MFWPLFFVICILIMSKCTIGSILDKKPLRWIGFVACIGMLAGFTATVVLFADGFTTYKILVHKLNKIQTLTIKGDTEAAIQVKADYICRLTRARYYKSNPYIEFFTHGSFISNDIFKLPTFGVKYD